VRQQLIGGEYADTSVMSKRASTTFSRCSVEPLGERKGFIETAFRGGTTVERHEDARVHGGSFRARTLVVLPASFRAVPRASLALRQRRARRPRYGRRITCEEPP